MRESARLWKKAREKKINIPQRLKSRNTPPASIPPLASVCVHLGVSVAGCTRKSVRFVSMKRSVRAAFFLSGGGVSGT